MPKALENIRRHSCDAWFVVPRDRRPAGEKCALALLASALALPCMAEQIRFHVRATSEVVALLALESPGADWAISGKEAAVAVIRVDGGEPQHVITWGGPYRIFLGRLSAGGHDLTIERDPELSRAPLKIGPVNFEEHTEPEYAHAPVLYARPDTVGNFSDVPLLMYVERLGDSLQYTVIFSNEDGGTSTRALMARWGRTTDIEYIYRVWPGKNRAIVQGKDHKEASFTGPHSGSHPLLIPFTMNNMVTGAQKPSALRFQLAPVIVGDLGGSRERVMDQHPATYSVMAKELIRERKLRPFGEIDGQKISDPRNYLYVEYNASHSRSAMTVSVALKDGRIFAGDLGRIDYAISRDGPVRTTVELPPGTRPADIEHLQFQCIVAPPEKSGEAMPLAGECELRRVQQAFLLDVSGLPGKSFVQSDTPHKLPAGGGILLKP